MYSRRAFCSVKSCHETSRFRRILSKNPTPLGYLRDGSGNWAVSSEESLRLILDANFPLNLSMEEVPLGEPQEDYTAFSGFLDERRLMWAKKSFKLL